jgi:hypothetical protein
VEGEPLSQLERIVHLLLGREFGGTFLTGMERLQTQRLALSDRMVPQSMKLLMCKRGPKRRLKMMAVFSHKFHSSPLYDIYE